jgi:membrane protein insertase Oxa1/YidC/SpoIIIJ
MVSNVMFIMIIVMGFSLPSAMGIYWFIGALISLAQTLLTRRLLGGMNKK